MPRDDDRNYLSPLPFATAEEARKRVERVRDAIAALPWPSEDEEPEPERLATADGEVVEMSTRESVFAEMRERYAGRMTDEQINNLLDAQEQLYGL